MFGKPADQPRFPRGIYRHPKIIREHRRLRLQTFVDSRSDSGYGARHAFSPLNAKLDFSVLPAIYVFVALPLICEF